MTQAPTIDRLLNLVPDSPGNVLSQLRSYPEIASAQDAHGYSLVHAAVSYGQLDLLTSLVEELNVDPNITDEDGETALFNAESIEMARKLLQLGVNMNATNHDGQTAAEKLDDEDEQPEVAAFLRSAAVSNVDATASTASQTAGANESMSAQAGTLQQNGDANGVHPPPPLPDGVKVEIGTMQPEDAGEAPDPEFRRRIEELAAREDFHGEDGQRELRRLVEDAVRGVGGEESNQGRGPRPRID